VEGELVEGLSQSQLRRRADLHQLRVAIVVRGRLPGTAEGVAIHLLPGHGGRHHHLAHQELLRLLRLDLTQIDHGVQHRARGPQQPMLQANELPLQRHVGLRDGLGVERPALHVDAVEGKHGARRGYARLQHGRKLHLVSGATLVHAQRPGRRRKREVVEGEVGGVALAPGNAKGKHELGVLTGVSHQPGRLQVGSRHSGGLGLGGQAHVDRPLGQCGELLAPHDGLQVAKAAPVEGQDGVALQLLPLESSNHVAVAGLLPAALPGDQGRQCVHLVANLLEAHPSPAHQRVGIDLDAVAVEVVGVDRLGKLHLRTTARQDLATHPDPIALQLSLQRRQRLVVALHPEVFEQLADSRQEVGHVGQRLLNLGRAGPHQPGYREALPGAVLGQLDDRRVALLSARVAAETHRGRLSYQLGNLGIEQEADPVEHRLGDVDELQQVPAFELGAPGLIPHRLDQDLEILPHLRMGRVRQALAQRLGQLTQDLLSAFVDSRPEVHHVALDTGHAQLAVPFRIKSGQGLQQQQRVSIALRHPVVGTGDGSGPQNREQGQTSQPLDGLHGASLFGLLSLHLARGGGLRDALGAAAAGSA